MTKENLHHTLQELIAAGKTKDVFPFLKAQNLPAEQSTAVALIEAEYNDLQKSVLKGLLSYQDQQLRKNQINNKLLSLFQEEGSTNTPLRKKNYLSKIFAGILLFVGSGLVIWWFGAVQHSCPSFPKEVKNKILIIPFENVAGGVAKPQTVLRDRINQLTEKNNLSTYADIGNAANVTMRNASLIAKNCKANVIIWGTYSSGTDSLRINLNYVFKEQPQKNKLGERYAVKDVMDLLQKGKMFKSHDDAILSLCGVIALREGNKKVAKKWFDEVKDKELMDQQLLEDL